MCQELEDGVVSEGRSLCASISRACGPCGLMTGMLNFHQLHRRQYWTVVGRHTCTRAILLAGDDYG